MANTIQTITVSTFSGFIDAVEATRRAMGGTMHWYRGITSQKHALVPSLFRNSSITTNIQALELERKIFTEFRFRSPPYDSIHRDNWDLLFLMQHYRAPTRLLDWTASPLIALFFAVNRRKDESEPAVVWALNPAEWNSGMLHDVSQPAIVFNTDDDVLAPYHPADDSKARRAEPLAIEGIINNPRINAQRGKFVISGHQIISMEDAATSCPAWTTHPPLMKIICDPSKVSDMSDDLIRYGISYSSIFPDLEGLAIEIKLKNGFAHV